MYSNTSYFMVILVSMKPAETQFGIKLPKNWRENLQKQKVVSFRYVLKKISFRSSHHFSLFFFFGILA